MCRSPTPDLAVHPLVEDVVGDERGLAGDEAHDVALEPLAPIPLAGLTPLVEVGDVWSDGTQQAAVALAGDQAPVVKQRVVVADAVKQPRPDGDRVADCARPELMRGNLPLRLTGHARQIVGRDRLPRLRSRFPRSWLSPHLTDTSSPRVSGNTAKGHGPSPPNLRTTTSHSGIGPSPPRERG